MFSVPRLILILALLFPTHALAQIPASEYVARRDSLAALIGEGVVLGFGAPEPMTDDGAFRQFPAFSYLTGLDDPNAVFLMVVRAQRPALAMLYLPAGDPRRALYDGFPPDSAATVARLGLGIRSRELLPPTLDTLHAGGPPHY
jgi:hypothetical protein